MNKTQFIYLVFAWLLIASCEDNDNNYIATPIVDVSDIEVVIPASGKTSDNTIITSNVEWNLSGANEWCSLSPENGQPGTTMVYFTLAENETYDDRNMHVTLTAGGKSTLITVTQKKKDALTITKDKFDIPQEGGSIEVKVNSNIEYNVKIPAASASWITPVVKTGGTKAITTTDLTFQVVENPGGNKREGQVIIEDEIRRFSDTIRVYQVQKDMIVLTENIYKVPMEGLTVEVELKANVDYEVLIPVEHQKWIHQLDVRSLRTDVVKLKIDPAPDDIENREAQVVFKDRNSDLQEVITIMQVPKEAVIVTPELVEIPQAGGKAVYEVLTNVDYEVVIPQRVDWVKTISTRSMNNYKLTLQVDPNPSDNLERTAKIVVKGKGEEVVTDTIYIHQEGRERLDERLILTRIYNALNGKEWGVSGTNWLDDTKPLSEWRNVKVNADGKVTSLSLSNKLIGKIPAEIGDLEYLETLSLSGSSTMTGDIPVEIGNLKNLKVLLLKGQFTTIPEELWKLEKLEQLTLTTISTHSLEFLGELKNLKKLILECNYEGPIPTEFGNLVNLTNLTLGAPLNPGKFTSIPAEIGNLTALTDLRIYGGVKGALPPEIGNLKSLTYLLIQKSELTSIPDEIGNLKSLKTLELSDNKIEALPAGIGGLESVTSVNLINNAMQNEIPSEIGNLKSLTTLKLNNNKLIGSIPVTIGELKKLTSLYLQDNQLSGAIPYEIGTMSAASSIYLQNNQLTGNIPSSIFKIPTLRTLNISNNKLNGSIPGEIIMLKDKLSDLYLQDNKLSGTLPEELCSMNLSNMNLENNNITGTIPEKIFVNTGTVKGNFQSSGSVFNLNGNRLNGEIPKNILVELKTNARKNWKITEQQEGFGFTNKPGE